MPGRGHYVKRGDTVTLRWNLGRDLTGVTAPRVIVAAEPGVTPVIDRSGVVDSPASDGVVSLGITIADFGTGLLEAGKRYLVEIEADGVTHPDSGYEQIKVIADLG